MHGKKHDSAPFPGITTECMNGTELPRIQSPLITQLFEGTVFQSTILHILLVFQYNIYYFCQFLRLSFCWKRMSVQNTVRNNDLWCSDFHKRTKKQSFVPRMAGAPVK